jgi:hypothetical protein
MAPGRLAAQEPLRWERNLKNDARPIQITADEAVTWLDQQGKRVFLLKGKVWVEQGDAHFRAPQAVVWIYEAAKKVTGSYRVDVYGEGDGGVSLELAAQSYQAAIGAIQLNTSASPNLKTFKSKIEQKSTPEDPIFQRAVALVTGAPAPTKLPEPKNVIQLVGKQDPLPLPGVAPPALAPAQTTPAKPPPTQTAQVQPPTVLPPAQPKDGTTMPGPVVPAPVLPAPKVVPPPAGPFGEPVPVEGPPRQISIRPRSSQQFKIREFPQANGEKAVVFSPGIIINVDDPVTKTKLDIEADRAVVWTRGDVRALVEGMQSPQGESSRTLEFYLSGNVEIRSATPKEVRILRCNEAYYDVGRTVAIALDADLELKQPGFPNPIHVRGPELIQHNAKLSELPGSETNGSILPYGAGLKVNTGFVTLEEKHVEKTSIFGQPFLKRETGEAEFEDQTLFRGRDIVVRLEDVPIFYFPYLQGDARDPLGPLESLSIGYSKTFGFTLFTSWNVYDLIGMDPEPGTRWRLNVDGLTSRGPSIGTDFDAHGKELFGIRSKYELLVRSMVIDDNGNDLLGGNRGIQVTYGYPGIPTTLPINHPEWRGRFLSQLNMQEMDNGFSFQSKLAVISDKNFLDQYYNSEWVNGLNQETYAYLKQQENNWAWTVLVEPRIRNWITETEWLPKVDGYWIGQDVLQTFTYTTKADLAYAHLLPTHQQPWAYEPTDVNVGTGRFDWWHELDLPLQAGPFKVVPYAVADFTYYTEDVNRDDTARVLGGGGIRGSIPFSRLYPDIQSELLNLNGIYHKIVLGGNYYWVHSDRSHLDFPQLDRLNDDETDQALRDIRPLQPTINPANAAMLNSGFFDPQLYAIRRLVNEQIDTRDSIEVVQLDLRQRWQTKRGFPGDQHIIDWMTLDVSASFFPQSNRDNFGELVNFLEYDWQWNIGDRTSLFSSGWFDPHEGGARVWNFGTSVSRPDNSSLFLAYRQIDPLNSKAVVAAVTIPFSEKYHMTASTSYDFGAHNQVNSIVITRVGTDLSVSLGFTQNTITNNFGLVFEIFPNLLPANKRVPGLGNFLASGLRQGP